MKKFLFIALLCPLLFSQTPSQLFYRFIPVQYQNDKDFLSTINTILDAAPDIDIKLVPYLIAALETDCSQKTGTNFKAFTRFLNYQKLLVCNKKHKLLNKQIQYIKSSSLESDIQLRIIEKLPETADCPLPQGSFEVTAVPDSNTLSFYTYVFLRKDMTISYNPTVSYRQFLLENDQNILNTLRRQAHSLLIGVEPEISVDDFIKDYIQNLELIDRSISESDELFNILIKIYQKKYTNSKLQTQLHVSAFFNNNNSYKYKYSSSTITPLDIKIDEKFQISQYGIALGCRFPLKNQKSIFSFVDFQLNWAIGNVNYSNTLSDLTATLYSTEGNQKRGYTYLIHFIESGYEIKTVNTFHFTTFTPIFYTLPNLFIGFGADATINSARYSIKYKYKSSVTINTVSANTSNRRFSSMDSTVFEEDKTANDWAVTISPISVVEWQVKSCWALALKCGINEQSFGVLYCF